MRQWLCVQLGTWHPYKQANTVVWSHWGPRIFAPLFNEMIADANFNKKARLTTIACFLTYVRLAYPLFRRQLTEAMRSVKALGMDKVGLSHLRDLQKLCQFFIPVVSASQTCVRMLPSMFGQWFWRLQSHVVMIHAVTRHSGKESIFVILRKWSHSHICQSVRVL